MDHIACNVQLLGDRVNWIAKERGESGTDSAGLLRKGPGPAIPHRMEPSGEDASVYLNRNQNAAVAAGIVREKPAQAKDIEGLQMERHFIYAVGSFAVP